MGNGIIKMCSGIIVDEDADINESVLGILRNEEEFRVKIVVVENAGIPFGNDINLANDFCYDCFKPVENQKGVYVFQEKNTREVLYVGKAGFEGNQSLEERVQQHYHKKDEGANFRRNWAKCNCRCEDKKCSGKDDRCFRRYLDLISQSRVIFFCICNNDDDAAFKQGCVLENWLGCLQSKYSHH